jgi:hypothetical protein
MSSVDNKICYAIKVNENKPEIIRVMEILFAHGYVFERNQRIRTIGQFLDTYSNFHYWYWIVLNTDRDCKAVVTAYSDLLPGFKETTIEDLFKDERTGKIESNQMSPAQQ